MGWERTVTLAVTLGLVPGSAAAADPCRDAPACRREGLCTEERGFCVARRDDDCARAATCRAYGHCTAEGGVCVVGSDGDCYLSDLCVTHGLCTVDPRQRQCAGEDTPSFDQCQLEKDCRVSGECTWIPEEEECGAASPADCQQSEKCETEGECIWDQDDHDCVSDWVNRNSGMAAGGVILVSLGGLTFLTGILAAFPGQFPCNHLGSGHPRLRECDRNATLALLFTGVAVVGAGVPLVVIGNADVPPEEAAFVPQLTVGPAAAQLEWRF